MLKKSRSQLNSLPKGAVLNFKMESRYIPPSGNLNKTVPPIVGSRAIFELSAETHNNAASSLSYFVTQPSAPQSLNISKALPKVSLAIDISPFRLKSSA